MALGRRTLRLALLLLATLPVVAAPGGTLTRPALAAGGSGLLPRGYDVAASYDPETSNLFVRCRIDFQVQGDVRTCDLVLSGKLKVLGLEVDGAAAAYRVWDPDWAADRGYRVYSFPGTWYPGQEVSVTLAYQGSPEDYYAPQDRYWGRATKEAVWLTSPWPWLPTPPRGLDPRLVPFRTAFTVPADWTVFVPGMRPAAVEEAAAGTRTYRFESYGAGDIPTTWFAGPYSCIAQGEEAGVPYSVWHLPAWKKEAEPMAAEVPRIIAFLAEVLGPLPHTPVTVIQVPPEQGGGVVCGDSQGNGMVVAITPTGGSLSGGWSANVGLEQLWAHEIEHSLAGFGQDEGLAEFVCDYYIARCYPDRVPLVVSARRDYVLRTIADHGDLAINEAVAKRWRGEDIPDWHAYCYSKPALVWHMFRGCFGDDKLVALLHALHRDTRPEHADNLEAWNALVREKMFAVGGEPARDFYDRWFTQAYRLDLALEDVRAARPAPKTGRPDWTVKFTIQDLHDEKTPPARDTIPWVEVAVTYAPGRPGEPEGGPEGEPEGGLEGGRDGALETAQVMTRVPLTGTTVRGEISVPGKPVKAILDPNAWILDYDASNNSADVRIPPTPAEVALWVGGVLAALLVAAGTAWLVRRRPKALQPPPAAGRAH